ncbi:GAF domain-containing protein [Aliterella atlantica]|uniref:GAF domain-containing protein n=1 Tax=Aliterella atlantica TaxID=1827278 RepID=UPI0006987C8A|nr:GAF domain-containing protein [Aliterella atlantica]
MTKQHRTVLIVDDFPPDREVYKRYLLADAEFTYTIVEKESAAGGLALCQEQAVDGILLDFGLPDLDGLEFLGELKEQVGDRTPPVIMITGQGNEEVAAQAIKNGAEDYLVKNHITSDRLQLAVRNAIENYRLRQKLQRSEARFRTSVENMLDCFGIYSAVRNEGEEIVDFRIDYLNAAALESNCMSKEQIGQSLGELLPAHYQSGLFAQYCQVVETGEPLIKEALIYSDKFGDRYLTKFYDLRASKLDRGVIVSWRDVTEREQAAADRKQQIEQERIITQIAQQIRASLDLEAVLQTTVTEIRQFLHTDRVIIFQVQADGGGTAIVESVGEGWRSLLSSNFYDPCFADRYIENYRQGQISTKTDIYAPDIDPCYVELLQQFQVRACLVAPLIQGEVLWGLIIAHHCAAPRQWQQLEIELIQQLSTSISIAIGQSELYQKVQNELKERQKAEIALQQQTERERLVNELAQRVRQSLDLEIALETTVVGVRKFLGCDRVFIYRFAPDWSGTVVVEAVEQGWRVLKDAVIEDTYFSQTKGEDYRQGRIQAVTDVYAANLAPCHVEMLAQFQIKANLVVPILQGEVLWGLLVANQCSAPRKWESIEIELLQQLATQVGIAIQQADLFSQVSSQLQERLKAEASLRESEAGLRLALEAAQMGTWNWNIQTGQIQWSANMEALFGLAPGEFDSSFEMFVSRLHPEDCDRVLAAIKHSVDTKAEYNIEFRIVYPNGQIRWAQSKGQVFYDDGGQPLRMAGVDLDITKRKQTETALQENEALFRGLFESDLMGIVFWNMAGQITDANDAFIRMTGYSRAEMQAGKIFFDDITPPEYQEIEANKFEMQSTGCYHPIEKEYICKDGTRLPILIGCAFLPGYPDRGVAFVLDISEQKHLKQEREVLLAKEQAARAEAEAANRSKDEFLAVVSHELRSPLNAILGWAKLLRTRKFDRVTTERALETIERNAQTQVQLIEDLLDVSRMIRGNLQLTMAPVQLATLLENTIDSMSLMAQAKQIQLSSQIEYSQVQVWGDLSRLQQIITNLVTNAIKFTPERGQVEISLHTDGSYAQIQVKDTGKGIAPEFLPYVFERFRRADSSTNRAKDGLGLGLAIASHLVELHGGTIFADSPGVGLGAIFTVTLPILTSTNSTITPAELENQMSSPLTGVRILVVDDNFDSLEFIAFTLEEAGSTVKTAESGEAALAVLVQFQPDILVSDISMPEMDGYTLLRRIRELTLNRPIGAIAVSAFAKEEDRQKSITAGFQSHITKPVESSELVNAIASLMATYNLELTCK